MTGVKSAMCAASQLPERGGSLMRMMFLQLCVNQKHGDDDYDSEDDDDDKLLLKGGGREKHI